MLCMEGGVTCRKAVSQKTGQLLSWPSYPTPNLRCALWPEGGEATYFQYFLLFSFLKYHSTAGAGAEQMRADILNIDSTLNFYNL